MSDRPLNLNVVAELFLTMTKQMLDIAHYDALAAFEHNLHDTVDRFLQSKHEQDNLNYTLTKCNSIRDGYIIGLEFMYSLALEAMTHSLISNQSAENLDKDLQDAIKQASTNVAKKHGTSVENN